MSIVLMAYVMVPTPVRLLAADSEHVAPVEARVPVAATAGRDG